MGGLEGHLTRKITLCGTGILPVLENTVKCESPLRFCTILNNPFMGGLEAHPTRKITLCGTGILPVLENTVKCEFQLSTVNCQLFISAVLQQQLHFSFPLAFRWNFQH